MQFFKQDSKNNILYPSTFGNKQYFLFTLQDIIFCLCVFGNQNKE